RANPAVVGVSRRASVASRSTTARAAANGAGSAIALAAPAERDDGHVCVERTDDAGASSIAQLDAAATMTARATRGAAIRRARLACSAAKTGGVDLTASPRRAAARRR